MTVTWKFDVEEGPQTIFSYGGLFLANDEILEKIRLLGFNELELFDVDETSHILIEVEADERDPRLKQVLDLLKSVGMEPSPHRFVPGRESNRQFAVLRRRKYEELDFEAAELLRIVPTKTLAKPKGSENGVPVVWVKSGNRGVPLFGKIGYNFESVVNETVRDQLEEQSFVGLGFEELKYARKKKPPNRLFRIRSDFLMPRCLTPRQDEMGQSDPTNTRDAHWDDGCFPAELEFERVKVDAMGKWDFALTKEAVGRQQHDFHYNEVVISRRVWRYLSEREELQCEFVPVRLV